MRALVTGGNGFIGIHLVKGLLAARWAVTVLDHRPPLREINYPQLRFIQADLNQTHWVAEALTDIDVIFHLAWATIHTVVNRNPVADVATNLIPTLRLIEACQQMGINKFIFLSSGGTVYGPAQALPIAETHPLNPITAYGITKLAVEKYLHFFNHSTGLPYVIFRPFGALWLLSKSIPGTGCCDYVFVPRTA